MALCTFGIVGIKNTTVQMFSTKDEDKTYNQNQAGDKLPDQVIDRRRKMAMGRRLAKQGAEQVNLFPVS